MWVVHKGRYISYGSFGPSSYYATTDTSSFQIKIYYRQRTLIFNHFVTNRLKFFTFMFRTLPLFSLFTDANVT